MAPPNETDIRSTLTQSWQTLWTRVLSSVLVLVSLGYLARKLASQSLGHLEATVALASFAVTLISLSIGDVTAHRLATRRETFGTRRFIFLLLCIWFCLSAAGILLGIGILNAAPNVFGDLPAGYIYVGLAFFPFLFLELVTNQFLVSYGALAFVNAKTLALSVAQLLLFIVVVGAFDRRGAEILFVHLALAIISSLIGIRWALRKSSTGQDLPSGELSAFLLDGLKYHPNAIGTTLVVLSGPVVLNHFFSGRPVASYQIAWQLVGIAAFLPMVLSKVFQARMSEFGHIELWRTQRKIVLYFMGALGLLLPLAYVVVPFAIDVIGGKNFPESAEIARILLLAIPGVSISTLLSNQWIARGFFWQSSAIAIVLGIFNLTSVIVCIPKHGATAAAWSIAATFSIGLFVNLVFFRYCDRH